jgi:superfamily II DNA helicase RecQ
MPNSQGGREPQMENAHMVLRDMFGHSTFRLSQEAVRRILLTRPTVLLTWAPFGKVIHCLLVENQNALVLFPTGGTSSWRISLRK